MSTQSARMNRLRWWWRHRMGWTGAAALLLMALAVLAMTVLRPAIDAARRVVAQEQSARHEAPASPAPLPRAALSADPRERINDMLPPLRQRGENVARLLELAASAGVLVERAEYAADDQEPGLSRLRITLPFEGSYAQTRAAIAQLLNGLPNAALDGVDIERPNVDVKALAATLRLSLYFRKDAP